MFDLKPQNDPEFSFPVECNFLKFNGSWPTNYRPASKDLTICTSLNWLALLYVVWSWWSIACTCAVVVFECQFFVENMHDVALLAESSCAVFDGSLNFFRVLYLRLFSADFKQLLEQFINHIWIQKSKHPRITRSCEKKMIMFHALAIFFNLLMLLYLSGPLWIYITNGWNQQKPYPYPMAFPYDAQETRAYILTYILATFVAVVVLSTFFAVDTIFGFFIIYTCGQFEILHERIDGLISKAFEHACGAAAEDESARMGIFQQQCVEGLKSIVDTHCILIQFSQRLEAFFSPMLLVNFTNSSILICVVGFQLVTRSDLLLADYIKFIVYGISIFWQLVVLCWLGESLITKSTETANHLYSCNWEGNTECQPRVNTKGRRAGGMLIYPTGHEFNMNLHFMIMCSQKPLTITAYKFSILSLQSFTKLISTSMSYFALLQSLYNDSTQT